MKNKILTVIFCIALVLLLITASIGLPIYCRFFYYIQIKTLNLEAETGFNYGQIKTAYDEVLNYLTLPGFAFGTGELKWSADGAAHFADCKGLFNLNLTVLICSSVTVITMLVLQKFKKLKLVTFFKRGAAFWSGIFALAIPLILVGIVAADFDKAFEVFHTVFFPGKDNWLFNPKTDEIILILPQEFFMNCAILIAVGLITFSSSLIAADFISAHVKKKKAKQAD